MSLGFPGMKEFTCRWKITEEKSPYLEREECRSREEREEASGAMAAKSLACRAPGRAA